MTDSPDLNKLFDDVAQAMTAALADDARTVEEFCVEWAFESATVTEIEQAEKVSTALG